MSTPIHQTEKTMNRNCDSAFSVITAIDTCKKLCMRMQNSALFSLNAASCQNNRKVTRNLMKTKEFRTHIKEKLHPGQPNRHYAWEREPFHHETSSLILSLQYLLMFLYLRRSDSNSAWILKNCPPLLQSWNSAVVFSVSTALGNLPIDGKTVVNLLSHYQDNAVKVWGSRWTRIRTKTRMPRKQNRKRLTTCLSRHLVQECLRARFLKPDSEMTICICNNDLQEVY